MRWSGFSLIGFFFGCFHARTYQPSYLHPEGDVATQAFGCAGGLDRRCCSRCGHHAAAQPLRGLGQGVCGHTNHFAASDGRAGGAAQHRSASHHVEPHLGEPTQHRKADSHGRSRSGRQNRRRAVCAYRGDHQRSLDPIGWPRQPLHPVLPRGQPRQSAARGAVAGHDFCRVQSGRYQIRFRGRTAFH